MLSQKVFFFYEYLYIIGNALAPSSSGLGLQILNLATWVRFPLELQKSFGGCKKLGQLERALQITDRSSLYLLSNL